MTQLATPPPARIAPARPRVVPAQPAPSAVWIQAFVVLEIVCQLTLLTPISGPVRVGTRIAAFAGSLGLLLYLRRRGAAHPATRPALAVLAILTLSLLHPDTSFLVAGLAQVALYAAILGPLFWATRVRVDPAGFRRVIVTLWAFHTLSSTVGILQVYYPGTFQLNVTPLVQDQTDDYVDSLKITLASGEAVFRPMGLTDVPGGAASAGFYAILFGMGLLLSDRHGPLRLACLLGIGVGLFCIYLCQVRSILVMAAICLIAFTAVLVRRGEVGRISIVALVAVAAVLAAFSWATSVGGEAVTGRLSTLTEGSLSEVYYSNRGRFLEHTINELLPQYPLGAGLGRWGMINYYFGGDTASKESFWVEIQWTGWLLDGGVPLILAYALALMVTCLAAWRIAMSRRLGTFWLWGGLVFAYNISALAITFNYPLFIGQTGLEFWLLNAVLFAAAQQARVPAPGKVQGVRPA